MEKVVQLAKKDVEFAKNDMEKDVELAKNDVELAKKDVELAKKDVELAKNDLRHEEKMHSVVLLAAQADTLRASGLLTGRGVYERTLLNIFIEEGLKGRFNATETCRHIAAGAASS
jgi:hypothetical protein